MRSDDKLEARKLRSEGMSIPAISKKLNISKGSISPWVKDIKLSDEQKSALLRRFRDKDLLKLMGKKITQTWKNRRLEYQKIGEEKIKLNKASFLYISGCMLYWAEGTKKKNILSFVNSDPHMIRLFMKFLREELKVKDENINFRFSTYLDSGVSEENTVKYWSDILKLDNSSNRKNDLRINKKENLKFKRKKLLYGTCTVSVNKSTNLVQEIFGAIQELGKFKNIKWLE